MSGNELTDRIMNMERTSCESLNNLQPSWQGRELIHIMWCLPPKRWLKINIDGAVQMEVGRITMKGVVHDMAGI